VCWKPCSSYLSFHLLREEFLSAPIHSPLSGSLYRSFTLRQGQRLDTSETKPFLNKERKPPNQSSKTTKSSTCTHATPPGRMHANHLKKTEQLHQLSSDRSDRSPSPVRPVGKITQHLGTTPVRPVPSIGQPMPPGKLA
jgi:hypothetical protein